jgi:hypothetical protein
VQRVARRFALVAVAGELATEAGLTGWAQGEVSTAAAHCLRDWIEAFGGIGNHEERAILEHVRAFIEAHGSSRFESMTADRERISNRVGYIQHKAGQAREYLIFPEAFKREVCKGFDAKQVVKVLVSQGVLIPYKDGKASQPRRTPDSDKTVRMYVIDSDMLFSWCNTGNRCNSIDLQGGKSVTPAKIEGVTGVTTAESADSVTPVTPRVFGGVTGKNPLNSIGVTPVTPVTPNQQPNPPKTANGYPLNTGFAAPVTPVTPVTPDKDTNALTQGGLDL